MARSSDQPKNPFAVGQRVFERYYLKRSLGAGGMGVVWLAHDRVLEQPIALKFLAPHLLADRAELDRLKAETRRSLKLAHPNIVRIHDFIQTPQGVAVAMEYVDGWSLWSLKVDKPNQIFTTDEIAPWIRELCSALHYAHTEVGLVHRDVKPANLLINSRGQLKITDFGLSRELPRGPVHAAPTGVVGTDWYMSPQQWTGDPPAVADDLYSLGATIYELLTGKPPFHDGDIFQQLHQIVPPSMTDRLFEFGISDTFIPLAWEEAIAACLAKDAARRPVSARELAVRLGL
jgi:serine/threonine protein kinase